MSLSSLDIATFQDLSKGRFILASKSPRRKQILEQQLGIKDVSVFPSGFEEDLDKTKFSPFEYVVETARQKALDVYRAEIDSDHPPSIVLAADTIVLCDDEIMEKPRDKQLHFNMLKKLRDYKRPHKVFTGLCCIVPLEVPRLPGYALFTQLEESEVKFDSSVSDELIMSYIKSGQGDDAAGGYNIQGLGAVFVEKVNGDFYNVMGLPVRATLRLIEKTVEASKEENSEDEDADEDY
uniref:ARAD1C33594p n=1 Tax=Blastobotrys adeninivorans TaxID=409370 RepID=A0A060T3H9_BLAAD